MTILCTIDLLTREVFLPADQRIASYDHNVDVIRFQAEPIEDFSLDISSIRIAAQGPNKARRDYAVDPSTVQIEEETGYITFDWPIPAGVTEMPIGTFKYGDKGQLIFSVCAEIIDGSTVSKAWHSDDGIITVVAHLEPESGGGETPEEQATNAQKIGQLQTATAILQRAISGIASGTPPTASSTSEMDPDESTVYINTTDGNWYYWNGTAWTSGGTYGGAVTDTTLSISGKAADAKSVGDALAEKADSSDVTALETALESKANADDVTAIESDVSDLKEELGDISNISKTIDKSIANILPSESVEATTIPFHLVWKNGTISPTTGEELYDGNAPYRLITDYLPVGDGIVLTPSNGFKYTLRLYDASFNYIDYATPNARNMMQHTAVYQSYPVYIDTAPLLYSNAKYVRVGGQNASNTVLTPSQNETTQTLTAIIGNGNSLDNVYAPHQANEDIRSALKSYPSACLTNLYLDYDCGWENGTISPSTGEDSSPSDVNNPYRLRTIYMPIGDGIKLTPSNGFKYSIRIYDSSKNFLGNAIPNASGGMSSVSDFGSYPAYVDTATALYSNAKYVRAVGRNASNTVLTPSQNETTSKYTYVTGNGVPLSSVFVGKDYEPYSSTDIHLTYDIDEDGHYTKGWLKLPSNYSPTGEPIPLIVFVHGSVDFASIDAAMTTNYNDYYNYLRDCGYAVFDCYGYGDLFVTGGANTWGTPTNNRCYKRGVEYVTTHYNVDPNRIFVACKSLGGVQAFSMFHNPDFNIKAVGMLAPLLDPIFANCGYSKAQRHAYLVDTGMLPDSGNVFDVDTITRDASYIAYMKSNAFVFSGGNPSYVGYSYSILDKIENSITNNDNRLIVGVPKYSLNRPLKIWIAQDDGAVSYNVAKNVIDSLQLAGMRGELRTMPSNTGGHHSVDNDENAPQQTNVTTRLGIEYASVPLAYYELEQFFSRFL